MWKVIFNLLVIIGQCQNSVFVYNTENTRRTEEIECIYYRFHSTIKYCIRLNTAVSIKRNLTVCLHGTKWSFAELLEKQISPWEILSWSSSVEKVDDYARLFYNHSKTFEKESFLCNCTQGYFGKYCEYQLLFDVSSFSNALRTQFRLHTNRLENQKWAKILCYETLLQCDYGMLCLDWRNICDGQQNCNNGIDEENCDLLEFNECQHDEYR